MFMFAYNSIQMWNVLELRPQKRIFKILNKNWFSEIQEKEFVNNI